MVIWPMKGLDKQETRIFDSRRRRFVSCGRLVHDKGFGDVIAAFARIASSHMNWDLVVIGDGPEEENLKKLAAVYGLTHRILFTGFSEDAHSLFRQCDVFVHGSSQEGFGLVIAEAQASGLPVVCYDCLAGPRDIVTHGVDGLLINKGDISALAAALGILARDEEMRSRMSISSNKSKIRYEPRALLPRWSAVFCQ